MPPSFSLDPISIFSNYNHNIRYAYFDHVVVDGHGTDGHGRYDHSHDVGVEQVCQNVEVHLEAKSGPVYFPRPKLFRLAGYDMKAGDLDRITEFFWFFFIFLFYYPKDLGKFLVLGHLQAEKAGQLGREHVDGRPRGEPADEDVGEEHGEFAQLQHAH